MGSAPGKKGKDSLTKNKVTVPSFLKKDFEFLTQEGLRIPPLRRAKVSLTLGWENAPGET
jgi:hypothetical protein